MIRVDIKPLGVNSAWQGKRFKTQAYKSFERDCLFMLPKLYVPETPYALYLDFGFSSRLSDIDGPTKLVIDILCKKYDFDDRYIESLNVVKNLVPKGQEYWAFEIQNYKPTQ